MKRTVLTLSVFAVAIGLLAQGKLGSYGNRRYTSPYDPKTRPPVAVPEAYESALRYLGPATNRFYCVSTTCLELGKSGFPAWKLSFSDTNGESAYLEVTFDKEVYPDPRTDMLLKGSSVGSSHADKMPDIEKEIEMTMRDINRDLRDLREDRETLSKFLPKAQREIVDSQVKALDENGLRLRRAKELLKDLTAYEEDLRKEMNIYSESGKLDQGLGDTSPPKK
jgi:hypothetical protein